MRAAHRWFSPRASRERPATRCWLPASAATALHNNVCRRRMTVWCVGASAAWAPARLQGGSTAAPCSCLQLHHYIHVVQCKMDGGEPCSGLTSVCVCAGRRAHRVMQGAEVGGGELEGWGRAGVSTRRRVMQQAASSCSKRCCGWRGVLTMYLLMGANGATQAGSTAWQVER